MTWRVIARQDRRLTIRARSVKLLLGLLVVGVLWTAYLYPITGEEPITTARFTSNLVGWLQTGVPLAGILLGYNAVVSERESGSLLLSLSLPHSREDVLLGKFLGRAGLVVGTILVALVGAGFLVVYPYGELELLRSLSFVLVTVLFGFLWTGLGVAISLGVNTKRKALVLGYGVLVLFVFLWGTLTDLLRFGLNQAGVVDGDLPAGIQFVLNLSPNRAFETIVDGFIDPSVSVGGPWYLGEWVAVVVFAVWLVAPLGLAGLRFAGRDLP